MEFSGLKRSLQLAGLAKDMTLLRASRHRVNEAKAREHVIERLGRLHGLPQKMAQILSLGELSTENPVFTPLTEFEATLTFAEIQTLLAAELNVQPELLFRSLDEAGISASLGQVHAGQLHSGEKVAVKVQYPGIAEALATDLNALGWISAPVGGLKKEFDLAAYQSEMQSMLLLELDYYHEAEMLKTFAHLVKDFSEFEVPQVFPAACNGRVLTMGWLEGSAFPTVQTWSQSQRQSLAESILKFFLLSFFQWQLIHSDPHPGNYRFRLEQEKPIIGLLDFGCVKKLTPAFVENLHQLIWSLIRQTNTEDQLFELFLKMDFQEKFLFPMRSKLLPLCQILFAPFLSSEPVVASALQMGAKVQALLGEDRWNFRFAGPAHLLFFLRAYQGLLQYLKALETPICWRELLEEYAPAKVFTEEEPLARTEKTSPPTSKHFLRIQLKQGDETKIMLKYRAEMAAELSELVPEDIQVLLREKKINLKAIQAQAAQNGFGPSVLFEFEDQQQRLKVWIA
jgi:hypothetical protein